jgi:hypothetical protein
MKERVFEGLEVVDHHNQTDRKYFSELNVLMEKSLNAYIHHMKSQFALLFNILLLSQDYQSH